MKWNESRLRFGGVERMNLQWRCRRGVEVQVDGYGRVFRLKVQKLSDDDMSSVVGDRAIDTDNSFFEKAREDVVGSFTSGGVLDHHWNVFIIRMLSLFFLSRFRCYYAIYRLNFIVIPHIYIYIYILKVVFFIL